MLKYSIKRIILALVTAFIILTLTFFLVKSLPPRGVVSPDVNVRYAFYVDQMELGYVVDMPNPVEGWTLLEHFHFDVDHSDHYFYTKPILEQYGAWLGNIVTKWDWGRSTVIEPNSSAINIIFSRLPVSFSVNIISVVISVPLGILFGIIAGLKKNTWLDHFISTLVMIFISIPSFVIIIFLVYLLGIKAGLPTIWPTNDAAAGTKALGYIIPVLSLSFGSVCGYTRFVRAELCEVMSSEYLLLARTKGLTKNQAITRHALRNAFVPILPSILAEFIGVFSGSMILESIYDIPGIGNIYIRALNQSNPDYNVLMVDMAVFTTVGLLAGIILDLSYGFIDPRIRMGEKNS
ncbi:MAG: ABC transporter permease [Firmicutes bacterium]|nr:ABC transporter permease [Candidatus Fiminaster equi]